MLALALVLDGVSRAEAAEQCGMDRQTLRDWVQLTHSSYTTPGGTTPPASCAAVSLRGGTPRPGLLCRPCRPRSL
jgi:transposase-like protein